MAQKTTVSRKREQGKLTPMATGFRFEGSQQGVGAIEMFCNRRRYRYNLNQQGTVIEFAAFQSEKQTIVDILDVNGIQV